MDRKTSRERKNDLEIEKERSKRVRKRGSNRDCKRKMLERDSYKCFDVPTTRNIFNDAKNKQILQSD